MRIDTNKIRHVAENAMKSQHIQTGRFSPDRSTAAAIQAAFDEYQNQVEQQHSFSAYEKAVNKPSIRNRTIRSEMRSILEQVENHKGPDPNASTYELELWAECGRRGFINLSPESGRDESGRLHIFLTDYTITPIGREWMKEASKHYLTTLPIVISSLSLAISIASLFISFISNFDKILQNWDTFMSFFNVL